MLKDYDEVKVKPWQLRKVLRKGMGMKYKKIKAIPWQGNSAKNLITRQHFALAFLKIDMEKTRIINVDETWLGMSDFKRMKWCPPGNSNSVAKKMMQPRISMIVGMDTDGKGYLSLLQANSNSNVMRLYYSHLIKLLNRKHPGWRKDTIIMMDNAPYHTSAAMMEFYEEQQLPIIFTGPHSYSASPIELFFAHFKRADINPDQLPMGKR